MVKSAKRIAIGIIANSQQQYFVQQREAHSIGPFLWEFPGGKVEGDETDLQALARELHEEVGIEVVSAQQLGIIQHSYDYGDLDLVIFLVTDYQGVPHSRSGRWLAIENIAELDMPQANDKILALICNYYSV